MNHEKIIKKILGIDIDIDEIKEIDYHYLGSVFQNPELSYESIILFMDNYKKEIISNSLKDESLIDNFLRENDIIDRTQRHTISNDYLEELINKIKKKEFDYKSITFFFYIINLLNLLAPIYDESLIRNILNTGLFPIVENSNLVSEDGDTIISDQKKIQKINILMLWYNKCGKEISPNIFLFELLKERIIKLLISRQVNKRKVYQEELISLLKLCDYSIFVRDSNIIPTENEVEQINNIFNEYDLINKSIIANTLNEGNILLVHFVRESDVNYQLIGNKIVDVSNRHNNFDREQSYFFIKSYIQNIIIEIQTKLGHKLDLNDSSIRQIIETKLAEYNNTMNRRPLDRLPIKKQETSYNFMTYIRKADNRLSCSLISRDNPVSHLNRKIGLILKPKNVDAIISTSFGYTCEKDFYDFRNDSIPCTELFEILDSITTTNETCVDVNKCEVIGVAVLSDDEQVINKAIQLAQEYNVEIISLTQRMQKNTNN